MSYCVNCGVELDSSLNSCPLCHTKVINPNALQQPVQTDSTYSSEKGVVEPVRRKDWAILITTLLASIAVTSGALNFISFPSVPWSLAVIGACVIMWVILIPVFIHTKQSIYVSVLYDGAAVLLYLFLISQLTPNTRWLMGMGVPITVANVVIVEGIVFCLRKFPRSFLWNTLYLITGIGVMCGCIEGIIDHYLYEKISLGWSAVVITICIVADIILITVLSSRRLRNAVRRRLHF